MFKYYRDLATCVYIFKLISSGIRVANGIRMETRMKLYESMNRDSLLTLPI